MQSAQSAVIKKHISGPPRLAQEMKQKQDSSNVPSASTPGENTIRVCMQFRNIHSNTNLFKNKFKFKNKWDLCFY